MPNRVYKEMIDVMNKRGGKYGGADIPEFYALVEGLFTPEEAAANNALPPRPVTAAELAKQMGRSEQDIVALLESMANKGTCATFMKGKEKVYRGAPFVFGIFEYQMLRGGKTERDKHLARLMHDYEKTFIAATQHMPKPSISTHRVVTVDRKIKVGNRIQTYDQISTYIDKYDTIGVGTCFCRETAELRGEGIYGMPNDVCMWFGEQAEFMVERLGSRKVTKQEAREILNMTEEAGLVHTSSNTSEAEETYFICNCDRWHCGVLKPILQTPKPALIFSSGFMPRVDDEKCVSCGTCVDRCPSSALSLGQEDVPKFDLDRCIGCGVCATGCPEDAIEMVAKPNWPEPPKSMEDLMAAIMSGKH